MGLLTLCSPLHAHVHLLVVGRRVRHDIHSQGPGLTHSPVPGWLPAAPSAVSWSSAPVPPSLPSLTAAVAGEVKQGAVKCRALTGQKRSHLGIGLLTLQCSSYGILMAGHHSLLGGKQKDTSHFLCCFTLLYCMYIHLLGVLLLDCRVELLHLLALFSNKLRHKLAM